jgi:CARDB/Periplasmic copper-binding protein (NosD)/Right handed beta helix region/Dockerin type I domain/Bacterial Ig-like domain
MVFKGLPMTTNSHHTILRVARFDHPAFGRMLLSIALVLLPFIFFCNLLPSPAQAACVSDVNGDSNVDGLDVAALAAQFGRTDCPTQESCPADIDGDHDVDDADLQLLARQFGATGCVAQTVVSGTISIDTTWTRAGSPYIVTSSITVKGADGADGITTLTIEPGVQVRFNRNTRLTVGASSGDPGALAAIGTAAEPVVFTSNQAAPAAGDWYNIDFENTSDDAASILDHCVVEYAGASQSALYLSSASPRIQNTTVRYSKYAGLYLSSSSPALAGVTVTGNLTYGIYLTTGSPTIADSSFSGNGNYDLYLNGTVGGTVTGCTIENGLYIASGINGGITGNTLAYNNSYPVRLGADGVGQFINENTINNLDAQSYLEVTTDTIERDALWKPGPAYHVLGNLTVKGTDGADGITTLTIEPGVQVRFNRNTRLTVGAASGDPGALAAIGTAAEPVVFTSNQAAPAAGDWYYIDFENTSDDAASILDHCVVEYAGASQSALYLNSAAPRIQNTSVRYSAYAGIYANGSSGSTASINCNTFSANQNGVYWMASPLPELQGNNFSGNSNYGVYYAGTLILNAENNWWGVAAGPNAGGDTTYGNVDADPWSTDENHCAAGGENHPPFEPNTPEPIDQAVRVSADNQVVLTWSGDDPDILDTVTYDLKWGATSSNLVIAAQDIASNQYAMSGLNRGVTYYWQIIARDNLGLETTGPVWRFTTDGDPPDLIISQAVTDPAGHLQSGQNIILTATIQNTGGGPVVDPFAVDFKIAGVSIGTENLDQIIPVGQSLQLSRSWTYTGGDPSIEIAADSQTQVGETNEDNNRFIALLSEVADNTAPVLTGSYPADGSYLQQVQQITATLADSQGTVDDAAVIASFSVTSSGQQSIAGVVTESNDTFTFVPTVSPLPDGTYYVSLTAADTIGNTRICSFGFTVDSSPPAEPVITGGTVSSGVIQVRPVVNTTDQFVVDITGTRETGTSVWLNGILTADAGDAPWAAQVTLQSENNAFELWLQDLAGNRGESVWVDIQLESSATINYQYDAAGRTSRINNPE